LLCKKKKRNSGPKARLEWLPVHMGSHQKVNTPWEWKLLCTLVCYLCTFSNRYPSSHGPIIFLQGLHHCIWLWFFPTTDMDLLHFTMTYAYMHWIDTLGSYPWIFWFSHDGSNISGSQTFDEDWWTMLIEFGIEWTLNQSDEFKVMNSLNTPRPKTRMNTLDSLSHTSTSKRMGTQYISSARCKTQVGG
jgi:hypothetical protein